MRFGKKLIQFSVERFTIVSNPDIMKKEDQILEGNLANSYIQLSVKYSKVSFNVEVRFLENTTLTEKTLSKIFFTYTLL